MASRSAPASRRGDSRSRRTDIFCALLCRVLQHAGLCYHGMSQNGCSGVTMVIIGIDPGLAHTGWGIIETRGTVCRARAYGCIKTGADEPLHERLGRIYQDVNDAIIQFEPTELAIEKIFFAENSRSAIATAHARGAALVAAAEKGLKVGEYTPMQIKQAVVGTGAADKHQVIFMVRQVLALDHDPHPDHCADALAAAICHWNLRRTQDISRYANGNQRTAALVREAEIAQMEQRRREKHEETAAATAARLEKMARERASR